MKISNKLKQHWLVAGLFLLLTAFAPLMVLAQQEQEMTTVEMGSQPPNSDIEMADTMRQDGKIYVVVGVFLLIAGGIVAYLIRIDGKVRSLEKQLGQR